MKTFRLSSGDQIPAIGLGTWKSPNETVHKAVTAAIKCGYKHIDCAPIYLNEKVIGNALAECFNKKIISREELWITSKLWNSFHAPKDVEPALHMTLKDLQVDYLDLYLIHWPIAFKSKIGLGFPVNGKEYLSLKEIPLSETWHAMEMLLKKGLVKNIGVSNFSVSKIQAVLNDAKYSPVANQVECHPYLSQDELINFCKKQNIHVTAYSPLGSGDHNSDTNKQIKQTLLQESVIIDIAKHHDANPAQVLLAWQIARGVSVIPKSTNENRIKENLQAANLSLSSEEMKCINQLNKDFRFLDGKFWEAENSPYTAKSLWQ